jgi:hypothetical protein
MALRVRSGARIYLHGASRRVERTPWRRARELARTVLPSEPRRNSTHTGAQPLTFHSILLVISFLCFVLAACGVNSRVGLLPLGLACWVLTLLLPLIR